MAVLHPRDWIGGGRSQRLSHLCVAASAFPRNACHLVHTLRRSVAHPAYRRGFSAERLDVVRQCHIPWSFDIRLDTLPAISLLVLVSSHAVRSDHPCHRLE